MAHSIPFHEGHGNSQGGGLVKWRSCLSLVSDRAAWPPTRLPHLLASLPWASRSPSLSFPFLICKEGLKEELPWCSSRKLHVCALTFVPVISSYGCFYQFSSLFPNSLLLDFSVLVCGTFYL